jgi:hypothetical protein
VNVCANGTWPSRHSRLLAHTIGERTVIDDPQSVEAIQQRMARVEELYLEGLEMKRQQIRRQDPSLSADEVEQRLRTWLRDRPMDAPGRVISYEEWKSTR